LELPESVLTKAKNGKLEVRGLESRGSYVLCKYLDPNTMKLADAKRKLILKDQKGNVSEYFIIPLKDAKRSLLVSAELDEKILQVWNQATGNAEDIWED